MLSTKDLWGQMHTVSLTMTTIVCGGCGIPFAIPDNYYNKLRENNGDFHCPNGCSRRFTGETEVDRLRKKLFQKENELTQLTSSKIQLESQLTKTQRKLQKVKQGQCPCCQKTYKHLAAHMKNKHPEL